MFGKYRVLVAGVITLGAAAFVACGSSERDEAVSLVRSVDAIDIQAPDTARREQIAALRELPLRRESLSVLRQACVTAHDDLLAAETQQRAARESLEAATQRYGDVGIPPVEAQRIASTVRRSQQKLAQAEAMLPACMQQVADLRLAHRVAP